MDEIDAAFRLVCGAILDSAITWALTGSLAFSIRGIDTPVGDIDIQTDKDGAYAIERSLKPYVVEPVQFKAAAKIRSHFGVVVIGGVSVEIMGDIEKLTPDGVWLATPPLRSITEKITYGELRIPVLNLEYEYQAYTLLGRTEKAQLLRDWLNRSRSQP